MALLVLQQFIARHKNKLAFLCILILGSVIYANSLHTPFIFDGIAKIVDNPDIRNLSELKSRLFYPQSIHYSVFERNDPVRPVTYLTFAINYYFSKLDTFFYHLFNVLLHIFLSCLMFVFTKRLMNLTSARFSFAIAFITSIFFVVHPVNTEVVTYIYHRAESLAAVFYFGALLLYTNMFYASQNFKKYVYYGLSLFCYAIACLSKQTAMTLPLVLLIIDLLFGKLPLKRKIQYNIPYWLLFVLFFVYRKYMGDFFSTKDHPSISVFVYFMTQLHVICLYLKTLVVGRGMAIDHFIAPVEHLFSQRLLIPLIVYLTSIISLFALRKRNAFRLLLFALVWFVVAISPTSSVVPLLDAMADRRVYLPSFGFYLCFAYVSVHVFVALKEITWARLLFVGVLGGYFLYLGQATIHRNQLYQSPQLLWEAAAKQYPRKATAYDRLGNFFYQKKQYKKAVVQYQKAIALNANDLLFYFHLGNTYRSLGLTDKAVKMYQVVLEMDPAYSEAIQNMANIFSDRSDYQEAIKWYQSVLSLSPNSVEAYINLGNVYEKQGQYLLAEESYFKALDIYPHSWIAYNNLAVVYVKLSQVKKAIDSLKQAIAYNPNGGKSRLMLANLYAEQREHAFSIKLYRKNIELGVFLFESYNGLGVSYFRTQQYDAAKEAYTKALEMNGDKALVFNNLGLLYQAMGSASQAVAYYEKAISIKPSFFEALYNLGVLYEQEKNYEKAMTYLDVCYKLDSSFEGLSEKIDRLKEKEWLDGRKE